jgi:hypothetical protein
LSNLRTRFICCILDVVRKNSLTYILGFLLILGTFLRFYHIEFGLPQSFYADEPEFTEPAIMYTYEFHDIVTNHNWYKLIPISYVYGTFPTYSLTGAVMGFSKFANLVHLGFDKTTLFILQRIVVAAISLLLILVTVNVYKRNFNEKPLGILATVFLVALNWKLIVHAHYVNADMVLAVLLGFSFWTFYNYYRSGKQGYLILTGIFLGLAAGTKITALLTLPLYLAVVIKKRDILGIAGLILVILIAFMVTNPFSVIFAKDFVARVLELQSKEAGLVFDSADYSPFKYISALGYMLTWPVFLLSLYGIVEKLKATKDKTFDLFLVGTILMYVVFYSLQSRRVDRWLLPILAIFFLYAACGLEKIVGKIQAGGWFPSAKTSRATVVVLTVAIAGMYLYYPALLLFEFQRYTPKSYAYLWAKDNLPPLATKFVYTEEGLDPMNKLDGATVWKSEVYASEGAQFVMPPDLNLYDYVILSSRPMSNFYRPEVEKAYPFYTQAWQNFDNTIENRQYFQLVREFTLPKPDLIPLSDVRIYKKVSSTL